MIWFPGKAEKGFSSPKARDMQGPAALSGPDWRAPALDKPGDRMQNMESGARSSGGLRARIGQGTLIPWRYMP